MNEKAKIGIHFPLAFLLMLLCSVLLSGCVSYKNQTKKITAAYRAGEFDIAQKMLSEKAKKKAKGENRDKGKDALLWRLEEATSFRTCQNLEESSALLNGADQLIREFEERSADIHLGQEAISAFSNPANIVYEGWTTDRIMASTYLGLDHIILGNSEQARVHLNKAYQRQQDAVRKNAKRIEKEQEEIKNNSQAAPAVQDSEVQSKTKDLYTNLNTLEPVADYVNPFTSYLRGIFFLIYSTDTSDLEISRKTLEQAASFAPNNKFVKADLELVENLLNGSAPSQNFTYVIFENGQAPFLDQTRIDLPLPIAGGIYPVSVAFPVFQTYPNQSNSLRVTADNRTEETSLLANMDNIFAADFKAELPKIIARTIATVVIKQASSIAANQALKSTGNDVAQLIGGLAIYAAQTTINIADTRSWTLLPHDFQVCRVPTPSDGVLHIAETRGYQASTLTLPNPKGHNLVYVKSVVPGKRMIIWNRKLP
mgnify:CR=1 FL=1|jgi:hypothetical protein